MQKPDQRIIDFLHAHHVLTLATCIEDNPWCSSVFYVYLEVENILVFTSERHTHHINDILANSLVAGTVVLETKKIGILRGLQFRGWAEEAHGYLKEKGRRAYFSRFPYAVLRPAPLWIITLEVLKFTDNRLGFGRKLYWERE